MEGFIKVFSEFFRFKWKQYILTKPSFSSSSSSSSSTSSGTTPTYRLYGIDHDQCMMAKDIAELKLDYKDRFSTIFKQKFSPEIAQLVDKKSRDRYAQIMAQQGIDPAAIEWMRTAGKTVESGIEKGAPIGSVVDRLIKHWKQKNGI